MRLLLLLSVLLSALTGVGASARVPGAAQAVAERSVAARTISPAARTANPRPIAPLPALRTIARTVAIPLAVTAAEPLWASRRRE